MINRIYIAVAFATLVLGLPATAQDTQSSKLSLIGNVAKICSFQSPTVSGDGAAVNQNMADASITLNAFVGTDGAHQAHNLSIVFQGAMCNYAAYLGLQSARGGLHPSTTGTAPAGFANAVNYTATATWGSGAGAATTTLDTRSSSKGNNNGVSVAAMKADLTVNIATIDSGGLPLIADGSPYTDVLTLQIGSQL